MRVLLVCVIVCLVAGSAAAAGTGMAAADRATAPAATVRVPPPVGHLPKMVEVLTSVDQHLAKSGRGVAFSPSDLTGVDNDALQRLLLTFRVSAKPGDAGSEAAAAEQALSMICDTLGLQRQRLGNLWVITRQPTVVLNNQRVPVVGAMVVPEPPLAAIAGPGVAGSALGSLFEVNPVYSRMLYGGPGEYAEALQRGMGLLDPAGYGLLVGVPRLTRLISIQAKDEPIAEFMAKVAKETGQQIEVHPAVPRDIKITATIAGLPAWEVISSVAQQSGLLVRVDRPGLAEAATQLHEQGLASRGDAERRAQEMVDVVVHIVPVSEITVTGARARAGGRFIGVVPAVPVPGAAAGR